MHGVTGFVESAALLVLAAFVLVTICSRIGVPSIVGYILAGIVIGPAGLGLIAESAALSSIGEIGVVLLLFALGLECVSACNFGSDSESMHIGLYDARARRALSKSMFARPDIWRLSVFSRLICPSVCPFDHGSRRAAATAA